MMPEQGTVAQFAAAVRKLVRGAGAPTTWTIIQQDGPNHLGLWCNMLPEYQMAAITSGCVPFRGRAVGQQHNTAGRRGREDHGAVPAAGALHSKR